MQEIYLGRRKGTGEREEQEQRKGRSQAKVCSKARAQLPSDPTGLWSINYTSGSVLPPGRELDFWTPAVVVHWLQAAQEAVGIAQGKTSWESQRQERGAETGARNG